jgi:hypothetical protein
MSKKRIYIYIGFSILLLLGWVFSNSSQKNNDFPERVKVSLREVGNQLLLSSKDSTSLVLPIIELDEFKYKLSFQNQLSFEPTSLVSVVKENFNKAELSNYYRVEVKQCIDDEVAYSYEVKNNSEKDIIPCGGRVLPINCYRVEVKFTNTAYLFFDKQFFFICIMVLLIVFLLDYKSSKKRTIKEPVDGVDDVTTIGSFQFYPEQNKLVKQATEISLSKKECELLAIFVSKPNEIIKREELTKKVWEDNGVFVGRSLDTYISKLRKKLKEDNTIKITNVHGVGYKLELK